MTCLSIAALSGTRPRVRVVMTEAMEYCILCAGLLVFLGGAAALALLAVARATHWV